MDIADQSNDKGKQMTCKVPCHALLIPGLCVLNLVLFTFPLERDSGSMMGRDRDRDRGRGMDSGPDKTDSDWRARPSVEQDDGPRRDDSYGDSKLNRNQDLYLSLLYGCIYLQFSYYNPIFST